MSIASRNRSVKRPNGNARRDLKKALAAKPARVFDGKLATGRTVTLALKDEPGHRDRHLIPKTNRHGQYVGPGGELQEKQGGAFGGVTKAERRRRAEAKERAAAADALAGNVAAIAA